MPEDPVEFLASHRAPIDAIIESVTNGGSARVRLLLSANEHQIINLRLAGVLAPRASNAEGNDGEEFGDEVSHVLCTDRGCTHRICRSRRNRSLKRESLNDLSKSLYSHFQLLPWLLTLSLLPRLQLLLLQLQLSS